MDNDELNFIQQETLNGLMLGDGSLTKGGSLYVERQIKDKQYLIYNYLIFGTKRQINFLRKYFIL